MYPVTLTPHPSFERFLRVLTELLREAEPWSGVVYRCTTLEYANEKDFVNGNGAKRYGGRWNALDTFPAVYGSLTPETAMEETFANYRRAGIPDEKALPQVLAAFRATLQQTLDLKDMRIRRRLKVSLRELSRGDWKASQDQGKEALTQAVGRAAQEAGFDALLVPSAEDRKGTNLVVFAQGLSRIKALRPDKLPSGRS